MLSSEQGCKRSMFPKSELPNEDCRSDEKKKKKSSRIQCIWFNAQTMMMDGMNVKTE